jgi:hypothetical protein
MAFNPRFRDPGQQDPVPPVAQLWVLLIYFIRKKLLEIKMTAPNLIFAGHFKQAPDFRLVLQGI